MEALIKAGAFDLLTPQRASLMASVALAFDFADSQTANAHQVGLFDFGADDEDQHAASTKAREDLRESARKKLEEEAKKPLADRKLPEYGTDKDFQLSQAINKLKGRPVLVSKTMTERKEEVKEN